MTIQNPNLMVLLLQKESEERDRCQSQVRSLQDRMALVHAQAEQLQSYRRHYEAHWQLQFRSGASPAMLQCYRQFVERLDAALAQQTHTVRHVQGLLEQAQQQRMQQEIRVASIEKLLDRRQRHEHQQQARAQQRSDDEWAQRAARSGGMGLIGATGAAGLAMTP